MKIIFSINIYIIIDLSRIIEEVSLIPVDWELGQFFNEYITTLSLKSIYTVQQTINLFKCSYYINSLPIRLSSLRFLFKSDKTMSISWKKNEKWNCITMQNITVWCKYGKQYKKRPLMVLPKTIQQIVFPI